LWRGRRWEKAFKVNKTYCAKLSKVIDCQFSCVPQSDILAFPCPCENLHIVKTYSVHANALENSKLVYEYVRIYYLSKYSKYVKGLPINMSLGYLMGTGTVPYLVYPGHTAYLCCGVTGRDRYFLGARLP
jgi:hypothetical protein